MQRITSTNYGKQLEQLGYIVHKHAIDMFGNKRLFKISPNNVPGSISYCDKPSELYRFIREVEEIRAMQEGTHTNWQEVAEKNRRELGIL